MIFQTSADSSSRTQVQVPSAGNGRPTNRSPARLGID